MYLEGLRLTKRIMLLNAASILLKITSHTTQVLLVHIFWRDA